MSRPNELEELQRLYRQLSPENKQYIQAVANALKFAQEATEKNNRPGPLEAPAE